MQNSPLNTEDKMLARNDPEEKGEHVEDAEKAHDIAGSNAVEGKNSNGVTWTLRTYIAFTSLCLLFVGKFP